MIFQLMSLCYKISFINFYIYLLSHPSQDYSPRQQSKSEVEREHPMFTHQAGHSNRRASTNLPAHCPQKHFCPQWGVPPSYTWHLKMPWVMQSCGAVMTEVNVSQVTWDLSWLLQQREEWAWGVGRDRCVWHKWWHQFISFVLKGLLTKHFSSFMLMLVKFSLYCNNTCE